MTDDAELLRQYAGEGSEDAFTEVVRRNYGLVYAAARRQLGGDAHRAQDVAQAVFIELARQAPAVARHPAPAGWLYTTTHFTVTKLLRTERRRREREQEAHAMQRIDSNPRDGVDEAALQAVLDSAMRDLRDQDRETLLLRYFRALSPAEIAGRVQVSDEAAQKRIERALDRLRDALARRGITSASAALGATLAAGSVSAAPAGFAASAASAALAAGAAGAGGAVAAGVFTMSIFKLGNVAAALGIVLLLGTAAHLYFRNRLQAQAERASLERRAGILRLRAEIRSLPPPIVDATITDPLVIAAPDSVRRMTAATALLQTDLAGPYAWTRAESSTVAEELTVIAGVLELSPGELADLLAAAEAAQREVVAAVLASAKVQLNENIVPITAETPEARIEDERRISAAAPAEQRALVAQRYSRRAAERGERELAIELPESPEARRAYQRMHAAFAQIMGREKFAFYEAVGAATTIEGMFDEMGLQPHAISIVSRGAGTTSRDEEEMRRVDAQIREASIASGKASPPERVWSAPLQEGQYDIRWLRTLATWKVPVTRTGGGLNSSNALSATIPNGTSSGARINLNGEALVKNLGPLRALLPRGF